MLVNDYEMTESEYKFSLSELIKDNNNNALLISNQTYRLTVYCMGLWFWIISGITYFGIIIHDDNLNTSFQILFYLSLCSISLMIAGIISTSMSGGSGKSINYTKYIKYASGSMWLLAGLLLLAVIGWSFHMNYKDYHGVDVVFFAMANASNYLPSFAVCCIISAEIIYDYGRKYIYFNIKLLTFIICFTSILLTIPIYQNKHSQMYFGKGTLTDTSIITIMKISYLSLSIASFIIFIIFVFIDKLQHYSRIKLLVTITLIIFNVSAVLTHTLNIDTSSFKIYSQKTAGQLHSNFLFLALVTYLCYTVFIVINNICSINFDPKYASLILNDNKKQQENEYDLDAYDNGLKLDDHHEHNNNNNLLNNKSFRLICYCVCLWYWILPDLCQYIMYLYKLSDTLSHSTKISIYLLIISFCSYIIAIILVSLKHILKISVSIIIVLAQILFVSGSILMIISGVYVIHAECIHLPSNSEESYCETAQITTYFIGILLPIYIVLDIQFDIANIMRPISNLMIFFVGALMWTIIIYHYDVDVNPRDNQQFRDDIAFVIRLGWTLVVVASFMIIILLLFTKQSSLKIVKRIFVILLLVSSGFCIISTNDSFGASVTIFNESNPLNPYAVLWTARYSKNYYFTLFFFCCISCYDVLMITS